MNNFTLVRSCQVVTERSLTDLLIKVEQWVKDTLESVVPEKCNPRISIDSRSVSRALSNSRSSEFVAATIEFSPTSTHRVMAVLIISLAEVPIASENTDAQEDEIHDEEST